MKLKKKIRLNMLIYSLLRGGPSDTVHGPGVRHRFGQPSHKD